MIKSCSLTKITTLSILIIGGSILLLSACAGKKNVHTQAFQVIKNFDINQYTGLWYEIARIDFKHEKDLKNVTAQYTLKENGQVEVINKGYNYIKNKWEEATGKAKFNGSENEGALKVSFFGPFYSEYNIVMMDPDYENVLIFGESLDYLWILSRKKSISETIKNKFIQYALQHGYDTNKIIWTTQDAQY